MSYHIDPKIAHYENYRNIVKKYTEILREQNSKDEHQSNFGNVDTSYIFTFDKNQIKKINKTFKLIRNYPDDTYSKNYILDKYWKEVHRINNDQTIQFETIGEPIEKGYQEDRVVFSGLERLAQLAAGKTNKTFDHYGIGTGTTKVLPSDVSLESEVGTTPINTTGFAESKGSTMQFAGVFLPTLPNVDVSESAIFDAKFDPRVMFLRTTYTGSNIVHHTANETYVAVSHIVYMLSV